MPRLTLSSRLANSKSGCGGALPFFAGLITATLLIELVLHLIELSPLWRVLPVVEQELGWPDPDTGYSLRPNRNIINVKEHRNWVRTNRFGFRGPDPDVREPRHVYRVAVMGDSFTEALEVPYNRNFVSILGRKMAAEHDERKIEALNFGVIGSGPVQQLYHWENNAKALSPDLTIFVISEHYFRSNEMTNDSLNPGYVKNSAGEFSTGYQFRERRSQIYRDRWQGKLFFALMDYSRVVRAIYLKRKLGGVSGATPAIQYRHTDVSCKTLNARAKNAAKFWRDNSPIAQLKLFDHYLKDMLDKFAEANGDLVVALYGLGLLPQQCKENWVLREQLHQAVQRKFQEKGIRFIDIDYEISLRNNDPAFAPSLFGFGKHVGIGHLNFNGHLHYAQALLAGIKKSKGKAGFQ